MTKDLILRNLCPYPGPYKDLECQHCTPGPITFKATYQADLQYTATLLPNLMKYGRKTTQFCFENGRRPNFFKLKTNLFFSSNRR